MDKDFFRWRVTFELSNIRKGKIEINDWQKINIAADILSKTSITIDDTPGITVMEMKK